MIRIELCLDQLEELSDLQKSRFWELLGQLELKRVDSIYRLSKEKFLQNEIDHLTKLVEIQFNHIGSKLKFISEGQDQEEIGRAILQRNYQGPISYKRLLKSDRREYKQKKFDLIYVLTLFEHPFHFLQ